jgi:hypothetical protein
LRRQIKAEIMPKKVKNRFLKHEIMEEEQEQEQEQEKEKR